MFSFKRFAEQFKIISYQNAYRHGLFLLIFCLIFLLNHFKVFNGMILDDDNPFDNFGLFVTIAALINSLDVFGRLRWDKSGIYYLMVPATITEKYLAALIYSTIVTFVVYLAAYSLVHFLAITSYGLITGSGYPYHFPDISKLWDILKDLFFFQSLYFLGSVIFRKNPFGKTTAVILVSIFTFSIITGLIIKNRYGLTEYSFNQSFTFNGVNEFSFFNEIKQFDDLERLVKVLIISTWVIPFACWIAAFFRLKTIQI